jgi:hypothetical protein
MLPPNLKKIKISYDSNELFFTRTNRLLKEVKKADGNNLKSIKTSS